MSKKKNVLEEDLPFGIRSQLFEHKGQLKANREKFRERLERVERTIRKNERVLHPQGPRKKTDAEAVQPKTEDMLRKIKDKTEHTHNKLELIRDLNSKQISQFSPYENLLNKGKTRNASSVDSAFTGVPSRPQTAADSHAKTGSFSVFLGGGSVESPHDSSLSYGDRAGGKTLDSLENEGLRESKASAERARKRS